MLILGNITLYFWEHFILYLRDETTCSSPKACAQAIKAQDQEGWPHFGSTARGVTSDTVGPTSPESAGSRFGVSPSPTQEADSKIICASGVSAGDARFGFLSPLGWPDWGTGRMHAGQTIFVRAHVPPSRRFPAGGLGRFVGHAGDHPHLGARCLAGLWARIGPRQHHAAALGKTGPLLPRRQQSKGRAGCHAQDSSLLRFALAKLCLLFLEFVSAQRSSRLARRVATGAGRGSGPPGPGLFCLGGVPTNRPGQRVFPEPLASWGPSLGSRRLHAGEPAAPLAKLPGTLRRSILSGQREAAGTRGGHSHARPSGRRTPPQGAAEPGSSLPAQCPAPGVVGVGDLYQQRPGDPFVSQGRSSSLWFALAHRNDLQGVEELFCIDPSARGLPVPSRGFDLCQADLYHSVPSLLLAAGVGGPGRPGAGRLELAQSSPGRGELPSGIGVKPPGRGYRAGLGGTARYPLPLRTSAPTPLHARRSGEGQQGAALEKALSANPQNYPDADALKRGVNERGVTGARKSRRGHGQLPLQFGLAGTLALPHI